MKKSIIILAALLALGWMSVSAPHSYAGAGENGFIQKLVEGSPWEGTWDYGDVSFSFHRDKKGRLQGKLLNVTGGRYPILSGDLRWVEVKGETLTFTTQSGTDHFLQLDPEGRLAGRIVNGDFEGRTTLWSSKK